MAISIFCPHFEQVIFIVIGCCITLSATTVTIESTLSKRLSSMSSRSASRSMFMAASLEVSVFSVLANFLFSGGEFSQTYYRCLEMVCQNGGKLLKLLKDIDLSVIRAYNPEQSNRTITTIPGGE